MDFIIKSLWLNSSNAITPILLVFPIAYYLLSNAVLSLFLLDEGFSETSALTAS